AMALDHKLQILEQNFVRRDMAAPSRRPPMSAKIVGAKSATMFGKEFAHVKIATRMLAHAMSEYDVRSGCAFRRPRSCQKLCSIAGHEKIFGKFDFYFI